MFIRSFIIGVALFGLLMTAGPVAAAPKFIPGINDLPLMPGLALKSEMPVVFDTPGGRIIEVFAKGQLKPASIRAFYGETLSQLGWQPRAKNEFQRDKELLRIEIIQDKAGGQVVRFSVVPIGP